MPAGFVVCMCVRVSVCGRFVCDVCNNAIF